MREIIKELQFFARGSSFSEGVGEGGPRLLFPSRWLAGPRQRWVHLHHFKRHMDLLYFHLKGVHESADYVTDGSP